MHEHQQRYGRKAEFVYEWSREPSEMEKARETGVYRIVSLGLLG